MTLSRKAKARTPSSIPTGQAPIPETIAISQADPGSTNAVMITNTVSVTGSVNIANSVTVSDITNTVSVTGTFWPDTQTVSGTLTANPTISTSLTTSQVTVTGSATQIFASGVNAVFREVRNPAASTISVYLGTSSVTIGSGYALPGGAIFDLSNNNAALYGIASTGSVTLSTIGW